MTASADTTKKRIRSANDLPDWFDLEKYLGAKNLNAVEWFELLFQRYHHFFWFDRFGPEDHKKERYDGIKHHYNALLQSRLAPLSPLTDRIQIALIGGSYAGFHYDKKYFSTFAHAISPLTVRRLYQKERRLRDNTRQKIRHYMDRIFNMQGDDWPTEEEHEWARSFIDEPIFEAFQKEGDERDRHEYGRSHDCVYIDLTVPDKILIQQFTDYLRQIRRRYPEIRPAPRYKNPDYKKWVQYGLLPYLDLRLWEKENSVSIPNRVMADAIFPHGEKGEEMIRKTTSKIANMVMDRSYIDFLSTIAAQEIAEKI